MEKISGEKNGFLPNQRDAMCASEHLTQKEFSVYKAEAYSAY